ncbi:hypothetical protein P3W45_000073 [Vairimorpha bombi]|jgi:hypothetical protein
MKSYKLIFLPDINKKKSIFTNINIKKLISPINISREKPLEEEVIFNSRKRSEVVEYESEEYLKLKNKESCPLLIEDSNFTSYTGKLQEVGSNTSSYFTFTRDGSNIYITPIKKWYRFTQKFNLQENVDQEEITKFVPEKHRQEDSQDSDKEEIDYEDIFEDDDGEDFNFEVQKEKKLSKTGKKLRTLVDNLEKGGNIDEESISEEEPIEETVEEKEIHEVKILNNSIIKACFTTPTLSVKELIRKLKTNFELNNHEKEVLKTFINEFCVFEADKSTGEKHLKLKK